MDFFYYGQWQFTLIILAFEKFGGMGGMGGAKRPSQEKNKRVVWDTI